MIRRAHMISILLFGATSSTACLTIDDGPDGPCADENALCAGGAVTTFDTTRGAFGEAADEVDGEDRPRFQNGRTLFKTRWGTMASAPAAVDGLGPVFNDASCEGCHARDGRSAPYDDEGATSALIVKLYAPLSGEGDPSYGGQFNHQAVSGHAPEGRVRVEWEVTPHETLDVNLGTPHVTLGALGYGDLAAETALTLRAAPPVFGLGLLEAIPSEAIIARADPEDKDGDGISGRAEMVWSRELNAEALGRFGWRADQATLEDQIAAAAFNDMGLTSRLFQENSCPPAAPMSCVDEHEPIFDNFESFEDFEFDGEEPSFEDPHEVTARQLDELSFYLRHLAVPARRDMEKESVREGEAHFAAFGCSGCHTPKWTTGEDRSSRVVSWQTIWPYTDLLMHDMGEALADPGTDNAEWRTPPLWGIGLTHHVNGHLMLLHDGRARTFEDAILWHGGEAASARDRFVEAEASEREALIDFLWSL